MALLNVILPAEGGRALAPSFEETLTRVMKKYGFPPSDYWQFQKDVGEGVEPLEEKALLEDWSGFLDRVEEAWYIRATSMPQYFGIGNLCAYEPSSFRRRRATYASRGFGGPPRWYPNIVTL